MANILADPSPRSVAVQARYSGGERVTSWDGMDQLDRVKRLLESLHTGVIAVDQALRITSINPAGEMLFEVSANHAVGRPFSELIRGDETLLRPLRQALASDHPITAYQVSVPVTGEREITVDFTATPLSGAGAAADWLLLELVPVDRLLQLAREEHLIGRHAANRAVLRGLAHEIKNPLGGLRGAAQLLDRELPNRELREFTRIIIHEADRLSALVDRMMGSHRPMDAVPLNVHEILEHIRNLLLVEIQEGLNIERDYDPSLPEIIGDRDQLTQAILNIVRNAVEASDGNGTVSLRTRIERQLTVRQLRHRQVVRIDIQDTGPGIPADLRDHIFYPMVTGHADGTGLGLSIAQDIVVKHGGLIEVTSRPGDTRFSVFLPLKNEISDD